MQVYTVGKPVDDMQETCLLRHELGRRVVPVANQSAFIHNPTEILVLRHFHRYAVFPGKFTAAILNGAQTPLFHVVEGDGIVFGHEPIILVIVYKQVLQPPIYSHGSQHLGDGIIILSALHVEQKQVAQLFEPHPSFAVVILFGRTVVCPNVFTCLVVWESVERGTVVNVQNEPGLDGDTTFFRHRQAADLSVRKSVRSIDKAEFVLTVLCVEARGQQQEQHRNDCPYGTLSCFSFYGIHGFSFK